MMACVPSGRNVSALLAGFVPQDPGLEMDIPALTNNSGDVTEGSLFMALKGTRTHGIDFAVDAARAGAALVVYDAGDDYCRKRLPILQKTVKIPCLGIDQLDRRCGEIVSRFYNHPSAAFSIIGVTGTDGKTSVSHLLVQALTRLGKRVGSIGTLGYGVSNRLKPISHTTPDAFKLQAYLYELQQQDCEVVVMEVSSHALQQQRLSGCQIDIGIFTNLGRDHFDYHGDRQNYAAAKARLFQDFDLKARVINIDDEFGQSLSALFQRDEVIRYSSKATAESPQVQLLKAESSVWGQTIQVRTPLGGITAQTRLVGDFNIDNTLACISGLLSLGLTPAEIRSAVTDLQAIPGRMEIFSNPNLATVIVDFAHTEQSLTACLLATRKLTRGLLWCVFGCGGDRDAGKRGGMGRVAEQLADRVIITNDNPRNEVAEDIINDILGGMHFPEKVRRMEDRKRAIEWALSTASSEDIVVIAGKGHECEQIVGSRSYALNDRGIVEDLMQVKP